MALRSDPFWPVADRRLRGGRGFMVVGRRQVTRNSALVRAGPVVRVANRVWAVPVTAQEIVLLDMKASGREDGMEGGGGEGGSHAWEGS